MQVKMPSSLQSDEVTMGRKITETSRQESLSPLSGEELFSNNPSPSPGTRDEFGGNLNVEEDTLAFFSDDEGELDEKGDGEFGGDEESETDGVEQEKEQWANHTDVNGKHSSSSSSKRLQLLKWESKIQNLNRKTATTSKKLFQIFTKIQTQKKNTKTRILYLKFE